MHTKDHRYKKLKENPLERSGEENQMTEQVILLDGIDPMVMFGPGNRLLDQIQGCFPKVRLIARGNEIKCVGEADKVSVFVSRMNELIDYYKRYNRRDEDDIERLILDDEHMRSAFNGDFEDALIFGTSG